MSKINTGGPAFPTQQWEYTSDGGVAHYQQDGMTLRDYFAAMAMQGFAACESGWPTADAVAGSAYEWADAMLKARQQ